jgi:P-type Cu2+ transporter
MSAAATSSAAITGKSVPGKSVPGLTADYSSLLKPTDSASQTMEFAVEGIHCASCMSRIEKAFAAEPGVRYARVNLTTKRLTVAWPAGAARPDDALTLLEKLGFKGQPFQPGEALDHEAQTQRHLLRALGVAGFAMMNIMLLSISVWSGHATGLTAETRDFFHWISALIALPTAAYSGRVFFESAIRALKARAVNMDVPISLGILLALGMSVVETLNHGEHAYFDGAVMLIFFLLLGRVLDQIMRRKTRDVAANLAALRAISASKVMPDGTVVEVPANTVREGDLIVVHPGDRIAVDGAVAKGSSDIDASLVTGETRLAAVGPGDAVFAGTINHSGLLHVTARGSATSSLLDEIERLLTGATLARSRYVRLADRAARLYAPLVHTAALLTFVGWIILGLSWQQALVIAITVLIITCPCALGLAIPAVQVAAAGALFRRQVLLNSGDAIERLATINTVVFDKTGTLTEPEPRILNIAGIPDATLRLAARLARSSRHPMAKALAAILPDAAPLPTVRESHGEGVTACLDGHVMRLGSPAFCGAMQEARDIAARYPDASLIAFRRGDEFAVFAVMQALRPDAASTVAELKRLGLSIHVLSGDRPEAVERSVRALGADAVIAGARPTEKVAYLEQLRRDGRLCLMVGDGLNDAAALGHAHVSLSPVSAADLTQAHADALFLGRSLAPVAAAVRISRKAHRVMLENLWLAVIYNAIAVPIAILGHATPLVAALAMSGSSLIVTLNALRVRRDPEV